MNCKTGFPPEYRGGTGSAWCHFLEPSAFITASEILTAEDFYRNAHQKIFQVFAKLNDAGKAVDLVTVAEELSATRQLEDVGGLSYLSELAASVPTAANIAYYAGIVAEKALLRRLIRTATHIAQEGYTREDDVDELLDEAERSIMEVPAQKCRRF